MIIFIASFVVLLVPTILWLVLMQVAPSDPIAGSFAFLFFAICSYVIFIPFGAWKVAELLLEIPKIIHVSFTF